MEFKENFEHKNESCYYCRGYYGPCFGEPVCATCHAFLFPNDASHRLYAVPYQEKTDDGDSGNEEPKEPSDFHQMHRQESQDDLQYQPLLQQQQFQPQDGVQDGNRMAVLDNSDDSDVDPLEGAAAIQPDPVGVVGEGMAGGVGAGTASLSGVMPGRSNGISASVGNIGSRIRMGGNLSSRGNLQDMINQLTSPRHPENLDPSLIHRIPPEVLMEVFNLLDDMTLWSVNQVCLRWHNLVSRYVKEDQWEKFTKRRWPLFRPLYANVPWQQVYTKLTKSSPCQICLYQMLLPATPPANENSWRCNRLRNELRTLRSDPPEGIEALPLDDMSLHWQASIRGPAGSPYEGGTFFLYIQIPPSYPLCPPIVRFITKIFHPNVSRHGDIGIDSIQHNWSLALTISKVLISIQSLLTDPYTKVCMEPEIGRLYESNKNLFEHVARAWTHKHAMHDGLIPDLPPITCSSALQVMRQFFDSEEGLVGSVSTRNEVDLAMPTPMS